jgi:cobyrinic acid a,c-diamide synthase
LAKAIVIAAPASGSGKTVVTLGILRALRNHGLKVASAKVGPDYIDPRFHEAATGRPCFNLDPWAMKRETLSRYLNHLAQDADLVIVEGVMGLFDGPEVGKGSTADLADEFDLPVLLVVDCSAMAQSIAALVHGFATTARPSRLAGVILNRVASDRHDRILRAALSHAPQIVGSVRRDPALALPSRHLGLVQAAENPDLENFLAGAARIAADSIDLDGLLQLARPLPGLAQAGDRLAPLGRKVAVATDQAFAFSYPHMLFDWQQSGAAIVAFSPLADEAPPADADAVFLPGGYPELHAEKLAASKTFLTGLRKAATQGALIYGECGGFMVLGDYLVDATGTRHEMAGLLPVGTSFANRKLHLGYRALDNDGSLPFGRHFKGHEFHYSTIDWQGAGEPLFQCRDAAGSTMPPAGLRRGNVMGSYAHIIA